jgi:hypothetical protein
MKTLIFSSMALVGLLLVGLQHQQLGQMRAENANLQQASAEATRLKADLAQSTGDEAQDEAEIARLREENRDLLKLRGEINQLREARAQFEKVSAENQRLVSLVKSTPKPQAKETVMQPVTIQINALYDRGLNTPEDALQTFYWAQRDRNKDGLSRSVTQRSWNDFRDFDEGWRRQNFDNYVSIEIVARRDVNATTVQLGVQINEANNPQHGPKLIVTLVLQGGSWRVDSLSR